MSATLVAEAVDAKAVETLLEELRAQGIRIPRPAEVRDYLLGYPDMLALTYQVCERARTEFVGTAALSLEFYVDPEIDDPHLVLYVRREPYDPSIWDGIERMRECYEDALADLSGWLHVTVDFRAAASK